MKKQLLFFILSFTAFSVQAQNEIQGHWEGQITFGGYEKKAGYPFEIHFTVEGRKIKGRTLIHKSKTEVISQSFTGRIFDDHSIGIEEIIDSTTNVSTPDSIAKPRLRKYQFIYRRSTFDKGMEGWWQDLTKKPFDQSRARGRIYLRKTAGGKA